MGTFRISGALLFTPEGQLALEERGPHEQSAGRLSLIGGGAEADETPDLTISRELKEETGLDPDELGLSHVVQIRIPSRVTGRDDLEYDVFVGRLPANCTTLTVDGRSAVLVDPFDLSNYRGRFTSVAGYVITQVLQGVLNNGFEHN